MALGLTAASALAACSPAGPTPTAATPVTPASEPTAVPVAPTADPISANVTVKTYVNALVNGDFTAAWDLLAPATQRGLETAEAFAAGRRLFMDAAGNTVVVGQLSQAPDEVASWIADSLREQLDADAAFVVRLDYPVITTSNGWEVLVVAPDRAGEWRIRIVR